MLNGVPPGIHSKNAIPSLHIHKSWNRKKLVRRKSQRSMGECIGFTVDAFDHIRQSPLYKRGMTTEAVCLNVIKPFTEEHGKCSFATILASVLKQPSVAVVPTYKMGPANTFVSHAWSYEFDILLETMRADANSRMHEDTFFWLDIVAINQHKTESLGKDFWSTAFRRSISSIGRTLLVMYPWTNPIPLTRCWCLWEYVYRASSTASLTPPLPPPRLSLCVLTNKNCRSYRRSLVHLCADYTVPSPKIRRCACASHLGRSRAL